MNFKKVLVLAILAPTIASIGNNFNVCFVDAVSPSSSKLSLEDEQMVPDEIEDDEVVKKVREVYTDILKSDLKYDVSCSVPYVGENLLYSIRKDCDFVEKNHRGVCKHFANYLIKRLRAVGIESYPLFIDGENGYAHQAVLYKSGEKLLVADITEDIVAIGDGATSLKENPLSYAYDLWLYVSYMEEENEAYCFAYLDVDITDKNADLSSKKKVEEKVRVLYEVKRRHGLLKLLYNIFHCNWF